MKTYVQQYGKERTGTNYVKALLGRNFKDFVLFDNRLGSKHEEFQSVAAWMEKNRIRDRSAFERLLTRNHYWRSRNVPNSDPFEGVHQPVSYEELLALRDGTLPLYYVVSIKNPYAFAVSVSRWRKCELRRFEEPPSVETFRLKPALAELSRFNDVYRSYWGLIQSGRAILARHEDLLSDYSSFLTEVQTRLRLTSLCPAFQDISETVAPLVGVSAVRFYREFYLQKEFITALSRAAIEAITRAIDWDVMRLYGYEPEL